MSFVKSLSISCDMVGQKGWLAELKCYIKYALAKAVALEKTKQPHVWDVRAGFGCGITAPSSEKGWVSGMLESPIQGAESEHLCDGAS